MAGLTLKEIINAIRSGASSGRARSTALDELVTILDRKSSRNGDLDRMDEKSLHSLLEALFECVVDEKRGYSSGKKETKARATTRLSKSAKALSKLVSYAGPNLKNKTTKALVDHITETLPGRDGELVEPLLTDYIKALFAVLSHQKLVELLTVGDGETWFSCVRFIVDILSKHASGSIRDSGSGPGSGSGSRASPAPGSSLQSPSLLHSAVRSSSSLLLVAVSGNIAKTTLHELLQCLLSLVTPPNAPVQALARDVATCVLQVFQLRQLSVSQLHQTGCAIITIVLSTISSSDTALAAEMTRDLVRLLTYWWQGRSVSKDDDMLNSVRTEILKVMVIIYPFAARIGKTEESSAFVDDIEDMLDLLWSEYLGRSERARLQLQDLTFAIDELPDDYLRHGAFGLRPHNQEGERKWAVLQVMALFEGVVAEASRQIKDSVPDDEDQPRKKRRSNKSSRLSPRLYSSDQVAQISSLQLISFFVGTNGLPEDELADLVSDMLSFVGDKNGNIASWAMIVCASSCLVKGSKSAILAPLWKQVWQMCSRTVSLPATSRAACVLLLAILESNLVKYSGISSEINSIVTTADISGPALLTDASLSFMLHILHLRNAELPNASQITAQHIVRWLFLRWNPADLVFSTAASAHARPIDFVNLLRACFGSKLTELQPPKAIPGGTIAETWKTQAELKPILDYVLLSGEEVQPTQPMPTSVGPSKIDTFSQSQATNSGDFNGVKRLAIELLYPKIEELQEICEGWLNRSRDSINQVTLERVQSLIIACISGALLIPEFADVNSRQSQDVAPAVSKLSDSLFKVMLHSSDNQQYFDAAYQSVSPYLSAMTTTELARLFATNKPLTILFAKLSSAIREQTTKESSARDQDLMDVDDDDFESQESIRSTTSRLIEVPRSEHAMQLSQAAFAMNSMQRLHFISTLSHDQGQVGLIPAEFLEQLLDQSAENFLLCRQLIGDMFASDFIISPDDALQVLGKLGEIISSAAYRCCEVAICMCLDLIRSLSSVWADERHEIYSSVGDLYNHFVKIAWPNGMMSPTAQESFAKLLFHLLRVNRRYGESLGLSSCRSTLLSILEGGDMVVKYFIGQNLPDVFGLYILKEHDDVFVEVLNSLPNDATDMEGIAFRLYAFAELACRWPTLLRRCIYHIFETPAEIVEAAPYATTCLAKVSTALSLEDSREIFRLFAPQVLYTWLERRHFEDIPYQIFGFESLEELLTMGQTEASAIMMMRGNDDTLRELCKKLGLTPDVLVRGSFAKILAYCLAHDISLPSGSVHTGESRIRALLGKEPFMDSVYLNFVDILAVLFDVFDQEDPIENSFAKDDSLKYAARIMAEIKKLAHSDVTLPPNQQPMFKGKYLVREIAHLCSKTHFEFEKLWSPTLVVYIARKLFTTIRPALGSLHACSVLRKVRVLVCLAGSEALTSYAVEMLLHSIGPYIVDSECTDDALGLTQYLLSRGLNYLQRNPSFVSGFALSTLASLRVFLESSQSSTSLESQFRATMDKARQFHKWFSSYLSKYNSSAFRDDAQVEDFKSIIQSASYIRSSGNAEKGTNESNLLLDILRDGEKSDHLLNESARGQALGLLCGEFTIPPSSRLDVIDTDEVAVEYGTAVWKSCRTQSLSREYLSWAGRVVGRSFAASGVVHQDLLRESDMPEYEKLAQGANGSVQGILNLLELLTTNRDCSTAGLAEAALRVVVTSVRSGGDNRLVTACEQSLSEALYQTSNWDGFNVPPTDSPEVDQSNQGEIFTGQQINSATWSQDLTAYLAQSNPHDIVLKVLPPILRKVKRFAEQAFPFVVHLVLLSQVDKEQLVKKQVSDALKEWLRPSTAVGLANAKLLINTILYLRTQEIPKESSLADRNRWLDIDFADAASAACQCSMFKTALLFAEIAYSEARKESRRSSTVRDVDISDLLLEIYENIDDPDAYYGLPRPANLANVLARVEYEKDGPKSLAFRGAQYDSNIRRRNQAADGDVQSLVRALGTLGLAGLSHSLLQTQQNVDGSSTALENTFRTARRLEVWNIPAPSASTDSSILLYKAYQSVNQATELKAVRNAVHSGLAHVMKNMVTLPLNTFKLYENFGTLAVLTEVDDMFNVTDRSELEAEFSKFRSRSKWMMSGRYDDVSQILSCRETTMSLVSQQSRVQGMTRLSAHDARLLEIRSMLLSSSIFRFHQATQESLNLATSLTDLIAPSVDLGLTVDAAVKIETANSLWDHGEMIPSIRMLQAIDTDSSLKKQSVPVSRSDLLSKIGHQVSVAKLEKPHDIQRKYLETALEELKGKNEGKDAGTVFHQFAIFCDEQLQNPDGLEDLARLHRLKKGKSDEVAQLQKIISTAKESQQKKRYSVDLAKAKQWLGLDEQELRRLEQTRSEFVRLSLENYLQSLIASDEHNNDALRFTALWLERSTEDATNLAVQRWLDKVPTRKFAPLMNQLSSRLVDQDSTFQRLLYSLVLRICIDHPYHGMYQIWAGTKSRTNQKDEVAVLRQQATEKVAKDLAQSHGVSSGIWLAIDRTSRYFTQLANEKNEAQYKSGNKIAIKDSPAAANLAQSFTRYHIPPPTLQLELSADRDYSNLPTIAKLEPYMGIESGMSMPKVITAVATDGRRHKQLVKGGNDDLRQDAIMEQVFAAVSSLLKLHRSTQQRNLGIRTYKVLPLTSSAGLIEFVRDTIPLHKFLMPAHERYYPKDLKGGQCRKEIHNAQARSVDARLAVFRDVTRRFHPVMRYFFTENFADPDDWFARRLAYTRSTAAISMLGHVLGLGDRHGHNILLDHGTGEAVHIDLGVAFEAGRILPVPEVVPFRLTRDIVDGMGATGVEGVFRRCCEFTLDALREEHYSITTILDVLRYDPLYSWSISPVRLAKLRDARREGADDDAAAETTAPAADRKGRRAAAAGGSAAVAAHAAVAAVAAPAATPAGTAAAAAAGQLINEPSEADRALEVVRKKLSKTLSVTATVNELIYQATDDRNLAVLYSGWAAYA